MLFFRPEDEKKAVPFAETALPLWSLLGSNQGPADYESAALTDWAKGPEPTRTKERRNESNADYEVQKY